MREAAEQASAEATKSAAYAQQKLNDQKACAMHAAEQSAEEIAVLRGEVCTLQGELTQVRNEMELAYSNFEIERGALERVNERNFSQLVELRGWFDRISGKAELHLSAVSNGLVA